MPALPTEAEVVAYFEKLSNWGRWGPDDELGTLNLITPQKRVQAARLIREGVTVGCGRRLEKGQAADIPMPLVHLMEGSGEQWAGVKSEPGMVQASHDWLGMKLHGTAYCHLDALGHMFWDGKMYNDRSAATVSTHEGATFAGIHVLRSGVVSRGVLLDFARLKGVKWTETREVFYPEDLEAAEKAQGVRVEEGDILFYRTGYYRRRKEEGAVHISEGRAGFHPACLPWFHERGVALLGGDTANDVIPGLYEAAVLPIHQVGLVAMGMWLMDNGDLEDLADACERYNRWEFHLSIAPLPLVYGTSSIINPIAAF